MSEPFDLDPTDPTDAAGYVPNPFEVVLYPDSAAAWAVSVTPGSATAGVLAVLDPTKLSQAGRVDALMALDRLQAWAAALQVRVMTALVEDPCAESPAPKLERGWAKEDVKTCLGESTTGRGIASASLGSWCTGSPRLWRRWRRGGSPLGTRWRSRTRRGCWTTRSPARWRRRCCPVWGG